MSTRIDTDTLTWSMARANTCEVPGCWHQPVIMAGGRCHQAFCDLHLAPAVDLALGSPSFPGWYRIEHITTVRDGQFTVTVHPL